MEDTELVALLNEKFRESAMRSERLEVEIKLMRVEIDNVDGRIQRLTDEVKLPSGVVSQRLTDLREQVVQGDRHMRILIETLDHKVMAVGEHVDLVNEKLDRFRAEVGDH